VPSVDCFCWRPRRRDEGKKLIEWVEWCDSNAHRCESCKALHELKTPPTSPPCDGCMVDLAPENIDVANVYMLCRSDVITAGMGQVIGISLPAIESGMRIYRVKNRPDCAKRVKKLFHHFLSENKKNES
jgi:hypothetical protein